MLAVKIVNRKERKANAKIAAKTVSITKRLYKLLR
jgi:hypothetical protein